MKTSLELIELRATKIGEVEALLQAAEAESRDLNETEDATYNALNDEIVSLTNRIERLQNAEDQKRNLSQPGERRSKPLSGRAPAPTDDEMETENETLRSYREFLRGESRAKNFNLDETRAIVVGTMNKGGNLSPDVSIVDQLIQKREERNFMRELATKHTLERGNKLAIPKVSTFAVASWEGETADQNPDDSLVVDRVELDPHRLQVTVKASHKRLASEPKVEDFANEQIARAIADKEKYGFIAGSGVGQPLGLFYESSEGIPAASNYVVSTGVGLTISTDKVIEATYELEAQYRDNAAWVMSPQMAGKFRKLKDDTGQYLWNHDTMPPRFFGFPVYESAYAPSTVASGAFIAVLGDLSEYHIGDLPVVELQRLEELYAETDEVGFKARVFADGKPGDVNAFVRLQYEPA